MFQEGELGQGILKGQNEEERGNISVPGYTYITSFNHLNPILQNRKIKTQRDR